MFSNYRQALARIDGRYRRAAAASLVSFAAAGVSIIFTAVSVPMLLDYLGPVRFGVWMTLYSVVAMLSFLDFGLGNGLLTALPKHHASGSRDQARQYVSSAYAITLGVATVLGLLSFIVWPFIPWESVFGLSDPVQQIEVGDAVAVLIACILLSIPINLSLRIQAAFQRGYITSSFDLFSKAAALGGILLVIMSGADLPWVVAAVIGAPVLAAIMNSVLLFVWQAPWIRPTLQDVKLKQARWLLTTGAWFFILQLVSAVVFASDNVIIANMLGPEAVTDYAVPRTMFLILSMSAGLLLTPLWPAYGDALALRDRAWILKTLRRSLWIVVCITGLGSALMVAAGDWLLTLWVGDAVTTAPSLLIGFALWVVLTSCGQALAVLLNAAAVIRFQVILGVAMACLATALKFLLLPYFGISGVIWGTVIAYGAVTLLPFWIYSFRWVKRTPLLT